MFNFETKLQKYFTILYVNNVYFFLNTIIYIIPSKKISIPYFTGF